MNQPLLDVKNLNVAFDMGNRHLTVASDVSFSLEKGKVLGLIDLTGLLPAADRSGSEDVLNGIAYDAEARRVLVTGKLWPKVYEIRIKPTQP